MATIIKRLEILKYSRIILFSLAFCFQSELAAQVSALPDSQLIYVDNQLTADCGGNYSIANRDCNGFDGTAFKNLAGATAKATAGTVVLIRGGVYTEQLSPIHLGNEDNYIVFQNYMDEQVEISGEDLNPAIWIDRKAYIIIEGLEIRNVRRWLNALGSHHLIISNNIFERALDSGGSSKTGVFLQSCSHIKILNNKLHDTTQDNLGLVDCDLNLIEGNTITKAVHTLWALKCSNYNIIRNNYFHNQLQKIGEIYDCDNAGYGSVEFPKLTSLDDTKYNVVEGNIFAYTASSGNASPYAGIQYAAQNGIVRNNIFYDCVGPPLDLTLYGDEATYNYSNRIYHNTFYNNNFGGISISGNTNYTFYDQKIKNNLLYKNRFIQNDMRWTWYLELNNKPVQIMTGRTEDVLFENNNIFSSQADELYVIAYGSRTSSSNPAPESLSWWQLNNPQLFSRNSQIEPKLVDPLNRDFCLQQSSPMIDAAAFLATTTSSGENETVLSVDDAGWFSDGFGIVSGDTVQLAGQTDRAIILSVDYDAGTLTVDRPLSWTTGQGVSLKYYHSGPDIGACEFIDEAAAIDPRTGSVNKTVTPESYSLSSYPNPFNPGTVVHYEIPQACHVKLQVYDISGRKVVQLASGYHRAGTHTVSWNAKNEMGQQIASEIYLLHLQAGNYVKTIKMMYIR
jgi:hypothetical protein